MASVDLTKIHQGPGSLWLGVAVPPTGSRLLIDIYGNPSAAAINAPAAAALSTVSGGTVPATTYYVVVTCVNPLGETLPSPEVSLAAAAGSLLVVASPPKSGNAKGYNVYASSSSGSEKLQNPSPIPFGQSWTLPVAGLSATGNSAPSANATGPLFAGAVYGAATIAWSPKIEALSADQVAAPIDARLTAEEQSIEAEVMETDYAKLRAYLANGIFATGTDPGLPAGVQNYEEISFGGLMEVPRMSIAIVSPRIDAPGKFVVSQLYCAYQAQSLSMPFSREKATSVKVKFSGLADPSRPAGDQVGKVYRQP
ncbi:MAG: hypothetical protein ACRD2G_18890 [Terriglobia bacterium]